MKQQPKALIGAPDRWAIFFDQLGFGPDEAWINSIRTSGAIRPFFVNELWTYCKLAAKEPRLEERTQARELAVRQKANFIFLVGMPSVAAMKNWLFVPPLTDEELSRYHDPRGRSYTGWFLGNFSGHNSNEVYFDRLGNSPLILGKSDGVPAYDALIAAMKAGRG